MGEKISFDVKSIMDVMYGESSSSHIDSRFIFADEGKQKLQEGEQIHLSEKDKGHSSFWRQ